MMAEKQNGNGSVKVFGVPVIALERLGSLGILAAVFIGVYFIADRHLRTQEKLMQSMKEGIDSRLAIDERLIETSDNLSASLKLSEAIDGEYLGFIKSEMTSLKDRVSRLEGRIIQNPREAEREVEP